MLIICEIILLSLSVILVSIHFNEIVVAFSSDHCCLLSSFFSSSMLCILSPISACFLSCWFPCLLVIPCVSPAPFLPLPRTSINIHRPPNSHRVESAVWIHQMVWLRYKAALGRFLRYWPDLWPAGQSSGLHLQPGVAADVPVLQLVLAEAEVHVVPENALAEICRSRVSMSVWCDIAVLKQQCHFLSVSRRLNSMLKIVSNRIWNIKTSSYLSITIKVIFFGGGDADLD